MAADRYMVSRPVASVRSAPGSFATGNVFAGARVDVVAVRGRWVYAGWAPGRCGWLMARGLEPTGERTATVCPPPGSLTPRALFAPRSYQLGCGEGCVYPARVMRCADRTAYANYDGAFHDPVGRRGRDERDERDCEGGESAAHDERRLCAREAMRGEPRGGRRHAALPGAVDRARRGRGLRRCGRAA